MSDTIWQTPYCKSTITGLTKKDDKLNPESNSEITLLLQELQNGNEEAPEALFKKVYDQLRAIAAAYIHREPAGHTLQATEIVNEAYLKLVNQREQNFQNRRHFFAIAATAMRHFLVDYAKAKRSQKRGGKWQKVPLEDLINLSEEQSNELLGINEALSALEKMDSRQARIVELHYFVGFTYAEIAGILGVSEITIYREWRSARAWLHSKLAAT